MKNLVVLCLTALVALYSCSGGSDNGTEQNETLSAEEQYELATKYLSEDDLENAVIWYRNAAEQGHVLSQYCLGYLYFQGNWSNVLPFDDEKAEYWLKKAAQSGYAEAQNSLGIVYEFGENVQDYKEAVYWYKKASDQGNLEAKNRLGHCYANGIGVSQNYHLAYHCFKEAEEKGSVAAIYNLGWLYEFGEYVTQNYNTAASKYSKAIRLAKKYGDNERILEQAEAALERVNRKMSFD